MQGAVSKGSWRRCGRSASQTVGMARGISAAARPPPPTPLRYLEEPGVEGCAPPPPLPRAARTRPARGGGGSGRCGGQYADAPQRVAGVGGGEAQRDAVVAAVGRAGGGTGQVGGGPELKLQPPLGPGGVRGCGRSSACVCVCVYVCMCVFKRVVCVSLCLYVFYCVFLLYVRVFERGVCGQAHSCLSSSSHPTPHPLPPADHCGVHAQVQPSLALVQQHVAARPGVQLQVALQQHVRVLGGEGR